MCNSNDFKGTGTINLCIYVFFYILQRKNANVFICAYGYKTNLEGLIFFKVCPCFWFTKSHVVMVILSINCIMLPTIR